MKIRKIQRKFQIFISSFIIMLSFQVNSQDTTFNKKYFTLVNTYSTLEQVYESHPEIRPDPPSIVKEKDEILFYNDTKEVIHKVSILSEEEISKSDSLYNKFKGFKIYRRYRVVNGKLLMIDKGYGTSFSLFNRSTKIFSRTGKFLIDIADESYIRISPNGEYFAACYEGEANMGLVYLSDIDVIDKQKFWFDNEASIHWDNNNYLHIDVPDLAYYMIKNYQGDDLFKYYYRDKLFIGSIYSISSSLDLNYYLVSSWGTGLYFIDKEKKLLWRNKEVNKTKDCILKLEKEIILTQTRDGWDPGDYGSKILLLALNNGLLISDIYVDEILLFSDNLIIVKKRGGYYEYKI